ncbi:MAG: hypothetical protein U9R15_04040 [Chloroflexota bacterium]|nr:hypothetical protein [Chloroflexota bacterium]
MSRRSDRSGPALDETGAGGDYWSLTGNAGTTPGIHFLGTTDEVSLTLAVNGNYGTVGGGGHAFSTGDGYILGGTIGQPDAGVMAGGPYILQGGFWPGGAVTHYTIYLGW